MKKAIDNSEKAITVVSREITTREAPEGRSLKESDVVGSVLNDAQLSVMLNKTPSWAIKQRVGGGQKMYTYVPHGYVTDTLNKAFGWDWDLILDPMFDGRMYAMEIEEITNPSGKVMKTVRHIAVCGHIVVRLHNNPEDLSEVTAKITKSGFGSQLWLPTMELGDALKAARSDLLKTCAFQLGIALDLYWNERAEIQDYEIAQEEREAKKAEEQKMQELIKSGVPTNFAALLSRANTDYGYDGAKVAEILGIEIDDIMSYTVSQIVSVWDKVVSYK